MLHCARPWRPWNWRDCRQSVQTYKQRLWCPHSISFRSPEPRHAQKACLSRSCNNSTPRFLPYPLSRWYECCCTDACPVSSFLAKPTKRNTNTRLHHGGKFTKQKRHYASRLVGDTVVKSPHPLRTYNQPPHSTDFIRNDAEMAVLGGKRTLRVETCMPYPKP